MTRLSRAWAGLSREGRIAAVAALALLLTMFLPWYQLQSPSRNNGPPYIHNINAFGDVSFVEAAIFLVAAGVLTLLLARAEGREFNLPGGDGTIVAIAGGWAGLLIFYRVFSRPAGHGYPVGIQWGFFLAFVAAGGLAYAGWRMRHGERPEPPASRRRVRTRPPAETDPFERPPGPEPPAPPERRERRPDPETDETSLIGVARTPPGAERPVPAAAQDSGRPVAAGRDAERPVAPSSASPPRPRRPRYPPRPGEQEQLTFEDPPEGR
jgi:hypothetical protein